jgi:hypothetical protein
MMRQPGNSRLFCVCMFDSAGVTGFSRKVPDEAAGRPFVTSLLRVVYAGGGHFLIV